MIDTLKRSSMPSCTSDMILKIQLISYHGPSRMPNFYFPIIVVFYHERPGNTSIWNTLLIAFFVGCVFPFRKVPEQQG